MTRSSASSIPFDASMSEIKRPSRGTDSCQLKQRLSDDFPSSLGLSSLAILCGWYVWEVYTLNTQSIGDLDAG